MAQLIDLNEVVQTLLDLANDVEENYKARLVESGHYTTEYALLDSVRTEVKVNDSGYEVVMHLNDYWKWVENDTKPHFPPPSAIMQWIEIKPIFPKPLKSGKIPTPKQLAYLIGRKIWTYGTKGTHDLERTKDAILPIYKEKLKAAIGHDVEAYIRKVLVTED